MVKIVRFADEVAWLEAIVADFTLAVDAAARQARRPVFCLAGGSTPAPAYRAMAAVLARRAPSPCGPATLVVGDERLEPRHRGERNETMIREAFSPAIDVGAAELVGWKTDGGEREAVDSMAAFYARLVAEARAVSGSRVFDTCYLGLGADGHCAGLFPGQGVVADDPATVSLAPAEPRQRVTLTVSALASSLRTRYLLRSAGKEDALLRLASGDASSPAVLAASGDAMAFVLG
ncbi:MAG: hypothetical protein CVV51_05710 [Spirochaetae bacterium HGW-Spirochaetae-7]|nr:MAG: hypothetical protein CVV51_05710 [Spirochaetae bacterium HGW-Spirochaetae-7]